MITLYFGKCLGFGKSAANRGVAEHLNPATKEHLKSGHVR
jgi:hypothetical protein